MAKFTSSLTLGKKIGQGHFGEVFLGKDPVHDEVAVKRMTRAPGEGDADWNMRRAGLLSEAQHLKQATHRNVVQVYHLVEDDTGVAILYVMEYCPGGSLQAPFDAGPMLLTPLRKAATEATQGLQALHARGMLHRDIKPANILLDKDGVAKLGDFGLVTDNLVLGYGSVAGYMDHIAREIHLGSGTSVRSDIWALGMTIYRLIHGTQWYAESPPPAAKIPAGGFCDGLAWLPHVPKKWRTVLRKTMRDDPADRYQSANDVLAALGTLPTGGDWDCSVTGPTVSWSRTKNKRKQKVQWDRLATRSHQWKAWSEPISGVGRSMTLDESGGVIGRRAAIAGLEAFFAKQLV